MGRWMDKRLIAWARAVKARRRLTTPGRLTRPWRLGWAKRPALPPLWLFTDSVRLSDPRLAVARLPKGLAGVVLRHDAEPGRAALGRDLARLCRARRLVLVVAGDPRLAASLGAGLHMRRGHRPVERRRPGVLTASAHDRVELGRAVRAGADLVFLGPAFATKSHPGVPPLGALRWNALARSVHVPVAALGGVDGRVLRALPAAMAAGAIGALT